jgi:divalent metal cation (Fe/Co/Zn/Cd) transporter
MDESHDSGLCGTGMDPVSRLAVFTLLVNLFLVGIKLALSYIPGSLALRDDVLTEIVVFAAVAGHDRQKSLFDF